MHITVIAKAPVAGLVKTRLCPPCTPDEAAEVAAAALADTLDAVDEIAAAVGARRVLLIDGAPPPWTNAGFDVVAQRGASLGERLGHGFADLGEGLIVGMETPHVAAALAGGLDAVRHGLDVLGLTTDGGYWMIGLANPGVVLGSRVFDGVPMSRTCTGVTQLRRLHALGRPVHLLPVARDLDTFDDLAALAASRRDGRLGATARRVVRRLT